MIFKQNCKIVLEYVELSTMFVLLRQADSFEHWLVMYLLKNVFWINFNPKK